MMKPKAACNLRRRFKPPYASSARIPTDDPFSRAPSAPPELDR
ncbi:MAG TPA: hypothetical protein V6D10_12020 [Trichocoleus sp.]